MTGQGRIVRTPHRQLRLMLMAQLSWLLAVLVLGIWWVSLLLRKAARIADLESQLGIAPAATQDYWARTQRMMYWESATFLVLLIGITAAVFWLYWRDTKRSRALQAFFASVTHELRTPLTSIRLQAESISDSISKDGPEHQLVQRLLEDTARLEGQVEETLELARIEGGGPVITRPMRLKPWIERSAPTWGENFGDRVQIGCELQDITAHADPAALQVIFRNLLENAIRHSGKSPVQVTIRTVQNDAPCVTFIDDGAGYGGDPSQLGELFQKGLGSQGAGVGLYLVCVLMERMGGKASFRNAPGFEAELRFREGANDG